MIFQEHDVRAAKLTDLPIAFQAVSRAPERVLIAQKTFRNAHKLFREDKSRSSVLWTVFIHPLSKNQFEWLQTDCVVLSQFGAVAAAGATDTVEVGCFGFRYQPHRDKFLRIAYGDRGVLTDANLAWVNQDFLL